MIIGIDASRSVAAQRTGTENYSLYLIRSLLALDQPHRYRLYFNQAPPARLFEVSEQFQRVKIPFPRLWTHVRLSWEMARRAPDVLFIPAHVLPLVHPRRSVVTVHDLGYLYYPEAHTRLAHRYLDWSTRYNARHAAHVIADSQATRSDLMRHYHVPERKISVIYPGGGSRLEPETNIGKLSVVKRRYDLPDRYLLYVGTIHPRKNLQRLVEAFNLLTQSPEVNDLSLVIAGKKGWLYESIFQQTAELGLGSRVIFPGYVKSDDLSALMSAAVAFVLPSLYEGFGLPAWEAMACGTPVVCSNVSALPEVVGAAALLVDPVDVPGLAEALRRIVTDGALRRELRQRGFEQASRFSWERCAREVLDVLEMVGDS